MGVKCQIGYVPWGMKDHRDVRALISSAQPLQVVLLPSVLEEESIRLLKRTYEATSQTSTTVRTFNQPKNVLTELNTPTLVINFGEQLNRRKRKAILSDNFLKQQKL